MDKKDSLTHKETFSIRIKLDGKYQLRYFHIIARFPAGEFYSGKLI